MMLKVCSSSSSLLFMWMIFGLLIAGRDVVQGRNLNACVQCSVSYSNCITQCSGGPISYYGTCTSTCSNHQLVCQLTACYGSGSSGGGSNNGGGGGNDDVSLSEEELELLTKCSDTITAANANGDDFLTLQEFQAQVSAFTNAVCPTLQTTAGALPREEYYSDTDIQGFYDSTSCALCLGLLDPSNPNAPEGAGTLDSCGCNNDATTTSRPTLPIQLSVQTETESQLYCVLVLELVTVQCEQPQPVCYRTCQAERASCINNDCTDFTGPTIFLQCFQLCDTPFYPCIQDCEKVVQVAAAVDDNGGGVGGNGSSGSASTSVWLFSSFWKLLVFLLANTTVAVV